MGVLNPQQAAPKGGCIVKLSDRLSRSQQTTGSAAIRANRKLGGGDCRRRCRRLPTHVDGPTAHNVCITATSFTANGPVVRRRCIGGTQTAAALALFERMGTRFGDSSASEEELSAIAIEELSAVIDDEQVPLSPEERRRLIREIADEVMGLGPLQRLLEDPSVTEIMVNRFDQIYVERNGHLELTGSRFSSDDHLRKVIERIVSKVGRRIDESSPLVDARLEDGSRVNAIIPPLGGEWPVAHHPPVRPSRR